MNTVKKVFDVLVVGGVLLIAARLYMALITYHPEQLVELAYFYGKILAVIFILDGVINLLCWVKENTIPYYRTRFQRTHKSWR